MTAARAEQVRPIIADHLGVKIERAVDDAALVDDLGGDSIDLIDLAVRIEREFNITIADDDCDSWRTVRDVLRTVEEAT